MAAMIPAYPQRFRAVWTAGLALALVLPEVGLAQVGSAVPDTAKAVRWLEAARVALDPSAEDLRVPLALVFARAARPRDALALSHTPLVLATAACASIAVGDTAAADTTLQLEADTETRGWLQARLVRHHLRLWWNKPPTADRVQRAARLADSIGWPEARVAAELSLAYHMIDQAHDTLAAQGRLGGTRTSYAAIVDPVRRAEYASSMAWVEAAAGDTAIARDLTRRVPDVGNRTWSLSRVARAFRNRGIDPRPVLVEAESLALARRHSWARASALDMVISGYDSVADAATIRRLRTLRPADRQQLPPMRLDTARMKLADGDTTQAERLVRTLPDPRRLGYRAAAMEALALTYRRMPSSWSRSARLYRAAVAEARRIKDRSVRATMLTSLAYGQHSLGSDSDTRRLPGNRALQDTALKDAEVTAGFLPGNKRVEVFRALTSTWGQRSPAQARRLLGRLPTYADSAEALKWMAIRLPTSGELNRLRVDLDIPLATRVITSVLAARARSGADTALATFRREVLKGATLPRDTADVRSLLRAGVLAADTAWLTTWAALQPTARARVAAYLELGLQALLSGNIELWYGHRGNCLEE